ncbi:MAG TPA: elongation factor G [Bryobacteraceae bacterium]|nr:elongation factor G [Bryobacteraceae bacterium]
MKVYEGKDVRNVGVVGHGHCGKTMLTSALLHTAGAVNRLLRPDEGNTVTDFDEEEIHRKLTISTAVAYAEWKRTKINLLDTPGFNIFIQDARLALQAADSALVLVDGVAGVEVMTEKVHGFTDEFHMPHTFFVNKLDRERADFQRTVEGIHEMFGRNAFPIQLPIGAEKNFSGIVDLLSMKAYQYTPNGDGKGREIPVPADMAEAAKAGHDQLVEIIAEGKDELMEEFFEQGTLPEEHMVEGLREAVENDKLFPILCGSAATNIGMDLLLNYLVDLCPSPLQHHDVKAQIGGEVKEHPITDSDTATLFVFKTAADPFAGRVSYFKVMSGVLKNDDHLHNARTGTDDRLAHLSVPFGKQLNAVPELHAGDIGAVAKLKDTLTGDTLGPKGGTLVYPRVDVPEPSIAFAISARSRQDEDRMGHAVARILEEDPMLRFYRDRATNEFLLAGTGQQHIEVIVSRLKRRYNVEVALAAPKVPYRETIRARAEVQGRHKKQTGGHGQFGDCWVRVEPLDRGKGFEFANEIFGGSIPRQYVPAIEKGMVEAAANGFLAGYPVVDWKVTVYDGSYHDVDSSEMAFKLAARKAFKAAMAACKPALLEPVMSVEVQAPVEYAGDLMGDMNGRRGRISGMDTKGGTQIIRAHVPMSEMLTYQNDLTSMTQGRATFSMEFDHYDFVPPQQAEKIISAAKAAKAGAEEEED